MQHRRGRMPPSPFPLSKFWGRIDREVKTMENCETCKKVHNEPESVPYIVHESAMARAERAARRLWITNLILIFLLVGTIIGFVYYENQFEDVVTTTYESDAMD